MLAISPEQLVPAIQAAYGCAATHAEALDWGGDPDAALFRVSLADRTIFVKVSRHESVAWPLLAHWHAAGVTGVIPPLRTTTRQVSGPGLELGTFLVAYPFVPGSNGFDVLLTAFDYRTAGETLRAVQTCPLPPALRARIPVETGRQGFDAVLTERILRWLGSLSLDVRVSDVHDGMSFTGADDRTVHQLPR